MTSARRALHLGSLMALAATIAIGACTSAEPSGAAVSAAPGSLAIAAKNLSFDRTTLEVPAGQAFDLVFDNQESAPHNIAIYTDSNASTKLFGGNVVAGPASTVYAVPAVVAGTYYFRCDVHTDMHGAVIAAVQPTTQTSP